MPSFEQQEVPGGLWETGIVRSREWLEPPFVLAP
jgi:hypothetical protein